MPHQGAWEGHVQGEAVQVDGIPGGRARDVRILNWRDAATGEPREMETLMRGSEEGGRKSTSNGHSSASYPTLW